MKKTCRTKARADSSNLNPQFVPKKARRKVGVKQRKQSKVIRYAGSKNHRKKKSVTSKTKQMFASDILMQLIVTFCAFGKKHEKKGIFQVDYELKVQHLIGAYVQYMAVESHIYFRIIMFDPASVEHHQTLLEFSVFRGPQEGVERTSLTTSIYTGPSVVQPPLENKLLEFVAEVHLFIIKRLSVLPNFGEREDFWNKKEYLRPPFSKNEIAH